MSAGGGKAELAIAAVCFFTKAHRVVMDGVEKAVRLAGKQHEGVMNHEGHESHEVER